MHAPHGHGRPARHELDAHGLRGRVSVRVRGDQLQRPARHQRARDGEAALVVHPQRAAGELDPRSRLGAAGDAHRPALGDGSARQAHGRRLRVHDDVPGLLRVRAGQRAGGADGDGVPAVGERARTEHQPAVLAHGAAGDVPAVELPADAVEVALVGAHGEGEARQVLRAHARVGGALGPELGRHDAARNLVGDAHEEDGPAEEEHAARARPAAAPRGLARARQPLVPNGDLRRVELRLGFDWCKSRLRPPRAARRGRPLAQRVGERPLRRRRRAVAVAGRGRRPASEPLGECRGRALGGRRRRGYSGAVRGAVAPVRQEEDRARGRAGVGRIAFGLEAPCPGGHLADLRVRERVSPGEQEDGARGSTGLGDIALGAKATSPRGELLELFARHERHIVPRKERISARATVATAVYTETSRGVSSAGRAPALQAGGRRFDPGTLHDREAARRADARPVSASMMTATAANRKRSQAGRHAGGVPLV